MASDEQGTRSFRLKLRDELAILALLVVALVIIIYIFPNNILRIVLGLPFVLLLPGYTLVAGIYPRKEAMGGIIRLTLSLALSIVIVILMLFILNYTPWGIRLESILWSIGSFIVLMAAIGWLRRRRLPEAERFSINLNISPASWKEGKLGKILSGMLVLVILGALAMFIYTVATPNIGQKFTEFYILEQQGNKASFPIELKVGEEAKIVVGIINNEYDTVSYRIEGRINDIKHTEVNDITLEHGEKWEGELTFTPEVTGAQQELQFFLYKNGDTEAYLEPLRLWVDVVE